MLAQRLAKNNGSLLPSTEGKFKGLTGKAKEEAEIKQANALVSLLENRYKNKVCFLGVVLGSWDVVMGGWRGEMVDGNG